MNRIALMVLKNTFALPGLWTKLCAHAKNPDNYPEIDRWNHIQKIMKAALKAGNVDLVVTGKENTPDKDGLLLVANHQGLFDVVALVTAWDKILCAVYKIELKDVPLVKQIAASTKSYAMDREDVRQSLTVIQGCTEQLKNNRNVLIFPEGTRSKNGNVMGNLSLHFCFLQSDRNSFGLEARLQIGDLHLTKMEDRCGKSRIYAW